MLKTDRGHLQPNNNSGKTVQQREPLESARGGPSVVFTDGDLYTNYKGDDSQVTPRDPGFITSARGFNKAHSQFQRAKQVAQERLALGSTSSKQMGNNIMIPSTHSGLVNDDDRWWLEPDAERRVPSKHPDSPTAADFKQHDIARGEARFGAGEGEQPSYMYNSNTSFNSFTAFAHAAGGQPQPAQLQPRHIRIDSSASAGNNRNQVVNPNDCTPHFAMSASAAHLHGGALVTADNPLGIPGGSPAGAGAGENSGSVVVDGPAVVAIPQIGPDGQPLAKGVPDGLAAGAAVHSPEDQLQDGGGLRRDTTLEIEAGYYADMLAALGEESNQKTQLEGHVGELSLQLTKERQEAATQEQALRLRVQELEVMQAHFQEYMNAMDSAVGAVPGTAPQLSSAPAAGADVSVGGSGSGSGSGAGAVPGTMPNLSHHPTMETALENDSRAASHSKEGVASHYDGA